MKDGLKASLDDQISSFKEEIESTIKHQNSLLDGKITNLYISKLEIEAKLWEIQGIWSNVIVTYSNLISWYPSHAGIEISLNYLEQAIVKHKRKLNAFDVKKIEDAMSALGDSHRTLSTRILELTERNISS